MFWIGAGIAIAGLAIGYGLRGLSDIHDLHDRIDDLTHQMNQKHNELEDQL